MGQFKTVFEATQTVAIHHEGGGVKGTVATRTFRSDRQAWSPWEFTGDQALTSDQMKDFIEHIKESERVQIATNPPRGGNPFS